MSQIIRMTLFKLSDAAVIQEAIQKYSTLTQDAVKVRSCVASICTSDVPITSPSSTVESPALRSPPVRLIIPVPAGGLMLGCGLCVCVCVCRREYRVQAQPSPVPCTMVPLDTDVERRGFKERDGKPYIQQATAHRLYDDPRSQGYTLAARTVFNSKADMDFYDNECAAHTAIKSFIKPKVGGPSLVTYMDA
ncbi:hypothetical protein ST47_g2431 [Ascochyta rabiei]|uniref:Stress-response A/B barrel domain-containing protein n=1 Tax=Didymella rabiei TaxID=5454 RepID=A0A163JKV2_DIDRA|nr:hypothetical protein ST47_g2431 [Ascochyta rabiei]